MDINIKTRIDNLTEAEAKSSLFGLLKLLENLSPCERDCSVPCWDICHEHKAATCAEVWLLFAKEEGKWARIE